MATKGSRPKHSVAGIGLSAKTVSRGRKLATAVREVLRQIVPVTNSFKRYCQLFAAAWQPSGKRGQTWGSVA